MSHTDIKNNGWIEEMLPEKIRAYAYLIRLDRPIGTWLLLLPGWWAVVLAAGGAGQINMHDLRLLVLFALGALVMRAAGCVINDLWDRKLDARVERTKNRPLASGQIKPKHALVFCAILFAIGFFILTRMSMVTVLIGIISIPMIVMYPLMKRITWWPQAFLGLTFNLGALMGWAAVTMVVGLPAVLLYLGGIFWTLGYDTIYAHQDKEDDMKIGIKSAALRLGDTSKIWVSEFYIIAFGFWAAAFYTAGAGPLSLAALCIAAFYALWQLKGWDINDNESSLRVFKSSRDTGLLVLVAALLASGGALL